MEGRLEMRLGVWRRSFNCGDAIEEEGVRGTFDIRLEQREREREREVVSQIPFVSNVLMSWYLVPDQERRAGSDTAAWELGLDVRNWSSPWKVQVDEQPATTERP